MMTQSVIDLSSSEELRVQTQLYGNPENPETPRFVVLEISSPDQTNRLNIGMDSRQAEHLIKVLTETLKGEPQAAPPETTLQ